MTHMKVHKCNQCDYASVRAWDLKKHKKIHSCDKTNKCNQYDYASFFASNFRRHMKTHPGEKSHKCNLCNFTVPASQHKQTNTNSALSLHPEGWGWWWRVLPGEGNKQRKAQIHFVHSQPGTQFQFTAYLLLSAEFLYKLLKTFENKTWQINLIEMSLLANF